MRRVLLAACLLVSLALVPARADSAHRQFTLMLCSVASEALRQIAFHSPDPRIAFAYKSAEMRVITSHLERIAGHAEAPPAVKSTILAHVKAMQGHLPAMPLAQMKMEHVLDWHKKTLAEFQKLRAALK